MYTYGHTHATVYPWRSENNLEELLLSYHVGPGDQIYIIRLDESPFTCWALHWPPSCEHLKELTLPTHSSHKRLRMKWKTQVHVLKSGSRTLSNLIPFLSFSVSFFLLPPPPPPTARGGILFYISGKRAPGFPLLYVFILLLHGP